MMKENGKEFFQNGAVKHTYIYTHEGQTDRLTGRLLLLEKYNLNYNELEYCT